MLGRMDAEQAIADLQEISPQVRDVVVVGADGAPAGSSLADEAAAARLADGAKRLVDAAEELRPGVGQLEAATLLGSVFVVRDGERMIAATTTPEPTVGLVFYDLKTCLRSIEEPEKKPPARRPAPGRSPAEKAEVEDAAS
jgi:predicted regulator of Ras-like GTPase activity (Roadblock/LC7/MglB family)